jgi:ATP-dependent DNA helicase DinG
MAATLASVHALVFRSRPSGAIEGGVRAADYLGPRGILSRTMPSYEERPAQVRMCEAVEETLESERILLVEAATGTGKTLAYLLPALLFAAQRDKRIVVSTGTKTLQDQIAERDIPFAESVLRTGVGVVCLKGLGNYLCLRRYDELKKTPDAVLGSLSKRIPVFDAWRDRTATGDRAELEALADGSPIWSSMASSTETRLGAKCTFYEDCFVTKMRARAEDARILVVNHHLFFADLALRDTEGARLLPDYHAVIFDEAHQLEEVATQFFGYRVSSARLEALIQDATRTLRANGGSADDFARTALVRGAAFFELLPAGPDGNRKLFTRDELPSAAIEEAFAIDAALDGLEAIARSREASSEPCAALARRIRRLRDELASFADESRDQELVRWVETGGRSTTLGASPIDVSALLREQLFYRVPSVVLTSATLSTGGNYEFVRQRLGLDFDVREELLPTPFDYESQAALYLPPHMPDPRDPEYFEEAAREIEALVELTGGGAFVLTTSFRAMNELAKRARLAHPILVQGDGPKHRLLDRFRSMHDAVLFATSSFWEGVDVPGDALRLVVIDKLPFDVPSDPLVAARCESMRASGESPFMRYLVPAAALGLKQGFGRLIRTAADRGIVAILDSRIVSKAYGKVFLESLPPARRCRNFEQVAAFWRREEL